MLYFDNAATTFPKPEIVYNEMDSFYRENGVNSGRGAYKKAALADNLINESRKLIKKIVGINEDYKVIFNSSATESINLILKGLDWKPGDVICYTPFEHNAVLRVLYFLEEKYQVELLQIPFNRATLELKKDKLIGRIENRKIKMFVATQMSNVIGNELPLRDIIEIKDRTNALLLVDGAQAAGLIKPPKEGIDYYVFAGHKTLYGPFGIGGFLINKDATEPEPLLHGGSGSDSELKNMPDYFPTKYEAGSPNIHAISGLNAALKWLMKTGVSNIYKYKNELTDKLIEELNDFFDIKLYLPKNLDKHISIISVKFSSNSPTEVNKILNENYDISVRTGLHCSPEIHQFLGSYPEGLVRFSLGYFNTFKQIEILKNSLDEFVI